LVNPTQAQKAWKRQRPFECVLADVLLRLMSVVHVSLRINLEHGALTSNVLHAGKTITGNCQISTSAGNPENQGTSEGSTQEV
jgi:hypothetical protein